MKFITPQIAWNYEIENINSIDINQNNFEIIVASTDQTKQNIYLRVWQIEQEKIFQTQYQKNFGYIKLLQEIKKGHIKTVNRVRYNNTCKLIASGGDDFKIIIWEKKKLQNQQDYTWGHDKEVFTLDWSQSNNLLISGGLDNKVIIWDTNKGQQLQQLNDATSFIKIAAINNQSNFLFTLSCDSNLRIYYNQKNQFEMILIQNSQQQNNNSFQTFKSEWDLVGFFREAEWAPDDSFFIVPQGLQQYKKKKINCAFAYSKGIFDKPSLVIPNEKPVILVRFCPIKEPLSKSIPLFQSKYKMYFAIGTFDSVTIYQSTQLQPLYHMKNIHYAPLTDLSWFQARFLLISSMDGYISIVQFEKQDQQSEYNSTVEFIEQ